MADTLTDLYLNTGDSQTPTTEKKADKPASLTDSYLSDNPDIGSKIENGKRITTITVRPPISQPTPEEAAATSAAQAGQTPNFDPSISLPIRYGNNVAENYQSAVNTFSQGLNDVAGGKPATGVMETGLGMLGVPGSLIGGAYDTAKDYLAQATTPQIASDVVDVGSMALPVGAAGKVVKAVSPSNAAFKTIVDAIGPDDLPHVITQMKNNPRLSLPDVSMPVLQMAQKLATTEGKQQNTFSQFVKDRTAGAADAVKGAYDTTMGAPVNVINKIETMKQAARDTGSKLINPIVNKTPPADITPVINSLDAAIASGGPVEAATLKALKNGQSPPLPLSDAQSKLFQVREKLRGDWTDKPNMFMDVKGEQGAHNVQSQLRAEAQSLLESQDPKDRLLGGKLMAVRNQLVDAIDKASGPIDTTTGMGPYKAGLSKYADDKQVGEAFQKGMDILKNRPTNLEDRPEFLEKYLSGAKPEQIEALREGARVAVDNQIRGMRNAVGQKGTEIPQIEFNADKLKQLFGEKEVDDMFQKLQHERSIADTNNKLVQGSQTAMRMKSDSRVDLPKHVPFGSSMIGTAVAGAADVGAGVLTSVPLPLATTAYLGAAGAKKLGNMGLRKLAVKRNENMADLMTAQGQARDNLIKALENHVQGPKQSLVTRVGQKASQLALPIAPP